MASQALRSPKAGTGAFHQSGCLPRSSVAERGEARAERAIARRFGFGDRAFGTHREHLGGLT